MSLMIDWLTLRIPCNHSQELLGGRILRVGADGELEYEFKTFLETEGSHDSSLRLKTEGVDANGMPSLLYITGNFAKFLQGHNLFGTDCIHTLVNKVMSKLVDSLGLYPTDFQRMAWKHGHYEVLRVDLTSSFELASRVQVRAWLRSAEHSAYYRHRGRAQLTKNGTLYVGKHSRRWALKFYSKGDELQAKGHGLPSGLECYDQMVAWADSKLRVELVIRSMELKRMGFSVAANCSRDKFKNLYIDKLKGLQMSDTHTFSNADIGKLKPRQLMVYNSWVAGHDLRVELTRPSFYRYRAELLPFGVDIAVKRPSVTNNVIPLLQVLEAKPAKVPEFALNSVLLVA